MSLCVLATYFYSCNVDDGYETPDNFEEQPLPPVDNTPKINGYEYVDLGLSVLWATHNVWAKNKWRYGGYYSWGEIEEKSYYSKDTYDYYKNGSYVNIGTNISGTRYDVAKMKWGDPWRLPTEAEVRELVEKCSCVVCIQGHGDANGYEEVVCAEFTGPNGNKIILPLSGSIIYNATDKKKQEGCYMTGSNTGRSYIYTLEVGSDCYVSSMGIRYIGYSVRPVAQKNF